MQVKFLDLYKINQRVRSEVLSAMERVLDSGWYIRGAAVAEFERKFAEFVGVKRCVGVANGLDALRLILRAAIELGRLKPGDEVIVPANTYIATILAITDCGLNPVLVEPDETTFNLCPKATTRAATAKTRAMMPVHLYGRAADMTALNALADERNWIVVEDAAQAQGVYHGSRRAGACSTAAGFSFYPGKNLGALGDAGCVTTDDDALADVISALGNYGSKIKYENEYRGLNSRLDEIQAAILTTRLAQLDGENDSRRRIADVYLNSINNDRVRLPAAPDVNAEHVWHLFVVRCRDRDALKKHLDDRGVQTVIHYPIPPHRQNAYAGAEWANRSLPLTETIHNEVLSLPISPVLTDAEVEYVVQCVNDC